jgi:hypothetical protein
MKVRKLWVGGLIFSLFSWSSYGILIPPNFYSESICISPLEVNQQFLNIGGISSIFLTSESESSVEMPFGFDSFPEELAYNSTYNLSLPQEYFDYLFYDLGEEDKINIDTAVKVGMIDHIRLIRQAQFFDAEGSIWLQNALINKISQIKEFNSEGKTREC